MLGAGRRFREAVLRYTAERPARALDALAVYYRECDEQRVTRTARHEVSEARVRHKWPLGDTTNAP